MKVTVLLLLLAAAITQVVVRASSGVGEWRYLCKRNFSSQIRLHHHVLLLIAMPWSGEFRSLRRDVTHLVLNRQEEFSSLQLMYIHKNNEKLLANSFDASEEITVVYLHYSLSYKYRGKLRARNILYSIHPFIFVKDKEISLETLKTQEDFKAFLQSTDRAVLLLEFCGWSSRLLATLKNFENGYGDSFGGIINQTSNHVGIEKKVAGSKIANLKFGSENLFRERHWHKNLTTRNRNASLLEDHVHENWDVESNGALSCTFEEFQKFSSFFSSFLSIAREFFLPPQQHKFALVSDISLLSSLGVRDSSLWFTMVYLSSSLNCSMIINEANDLKNILLADESIVVELNGNEEYLAPAVPATRPSVILFVDRYSQVSKTRRKSKEALTMFRKLAMHYQNSAQFSQKHGNPRRINIDGTSSKHQLLTRDSKFNTLVTTWNIASGLQESSLHDILSYFLEQKQKTKLSSVAKESGFQLISNEVDIRILSDGLVPNLEVEREAVSLKVEDRKKKFNGSFFFSDGNYRLLSSLTGDAVVPSLIITDPAMQQHYISIQPAFSYSSMVDFLDEFLNESAVPYQRSDSKLIKVKDHSHQLEKNTELCEAGFIPPIAAHSFAELVRGSNQFASDKDFLVLFTNSWCGFCQRMEVVVCAAYRAIKVYANMLKAIPKETETETMFNGEDLKNAGVDIPLIFLMDCTLNDCSLILKSLDRSEAYPALLLFPAESKAGIFFEGNLAVSDVLQFIIHYGSRSQHLSGILWAMSEKGDANSLKKQEHRANPRKDDLFQNKTEIVAMAIPQVAVGSVLTATDKLITQPFDNSMVLIVRADQNTGFVGLIYNKQIEWDSVEGLEEELMFLRGAPLSPGGPIAIHGMPLSALTRRVSIPGQYPEVVPGTYYIEQLATLSVINLLKSQNQSLQDYWFFLGFSSWAWSQLYEEIFQGAWHVTRGLAQLNWP